MRATSLLMAALAVGGPAAAQSPPAKPQEPKPAAPAVSAPEFDVSFLDGSNVKVVVLEAAFGVTTKYGRLTVPVAELKRVALGFRYPEGVEAKLLAAVERLGAPVFADRDAAAEEVLTLKQYAGPILRRAAQDADAERARRAKALLAAVRKDVPADRVDAKDYDTVETAEFAVRGRLDVAAFKARTKQFGEAEIRLAEVKQFRSLAVPADTGEIALDAAAHARLNWSSWLDTGIDVAAGEPLSVTCTGTIDLWPQDAGKYMSSPAGNGNIAPNQQNNIRMLGPVRAPNQRAVNFNPGTITQVTAGTVVGKFGPAGQPFFVGASLNLARSPEGGRLFLQIAPSNWNNENCTGSYKIKVKTAAE